ncbi:MAG: bacillithiol biosynthesis protein BshC [Planctomycetota bacterium]|jgi:uncharacterized protein YllA (UPF0747 family)
MRDFSSVAHLFPYDPSTSTSFEARLGTLEGRRRLGESLHLTLAEFNRKLGGGEATEVNLARLARGEAVAVSTRIKPSPAGGAGGSFSKLATSAALCQALEDRGLGGFVPIAFLDDDAGDEEVEITPHDLPPDPRPLEDRKLITPRPGDPPPVAFGRVLHGCFQEQGFVCTDHRLLRPEGLPLFEQELIDPGGIRAILDETSALLRSGGFDVPWAETGPTDLFVEEEGGAMSHVGWDGDRFTFAGGEEVEPFDLLCRVEDLAPGPLLRPILGDMAFPAVATVVGPAGAALFSRIVPLYSYFGLPAPLVFPRMSLRLAGEQPGSPEREAGPAERSTPWVRDWALHAGSLMGSVLAGADPFDFRTQLIEV